MFLSRLRNTRCFQLKPAPFEAVLKHSANWLCLFTVVSGLIINGIYFWSFVICFLFQDPKYLHKFIGMNGDTFDDLLHIVGPSISKLSTNFKESITPEERLAVSLRFLAEGMCIQWYLFEITRKNAGKNMISMPVYEHGFWLPKMTFSSFLTR